MTSIPVTLRKAVQVGGEPLSVEGIVVPLDRITHLPAAALWRAPLKAHGEEDSEWDWSGILQEADTNQSLGKRHYEAYALECEGKLQALVLLEMEAYRTREDGKPVVYVEYVAVAPWNRRTIQDPPSFAGCGSGIISMAIERSNDYGYGGAIALHSLSRADGFYLRMGMKDFGPDPEEDGFHYFELT